MVILEFALLIASKGRTTDSGGTEAAEAALGGDGCAAVAAAKENFSGAGVK